MIVVDIGLVAIGLAGLYFGGEWLVQGASRLATALGISALIIGLTVVALGTSMPELVVSVSAALAGTSDIALGNVIGSNIANIGLILGVSGLIRVITIHISLIRREIPIMIGVSVITLGMASDGIISQLEGILLFFGYVVFVFVMYRLTPKENGNSEKEFISEVKAEVESIEGQPIIKLEAINRWRELGILFSGLVVLIVAAQFTITGAVNIARTIGVSELVIGLTLVAVGTSLPELATSVMASFRGHSDIAAGNVVGSNIANLLVILGSSASARQINLDSTVITQDLPIMLFFAVILVPFVWSHTLGKWEAMGLLLLYAAYVVFTVANG